MGTFSPGWEGFRVDFIVISSKVEVGDDEGVGFVQEVV